MRNTIKNILKEDWEWVNDVRTPLEIGEPLSQTNPKNTFRIHFTTTHGEDGSTWSDDWVNFKGDDIDNILSYVKNIKIMGEKGYYGLISYIVDSVFDSTFKIEDLPHYSRYKEDYTELIEVGERDDLYDFLHDIYSDEGFFQWNSYYGEPAEIERYWVTYFDEYGVEHKVKINHDEL